VVEVRGGDVGAGLACQSSDSALVETAVTIPITTTWWINSLVPVWTLDLMLKEIEDLRNKRIDIAIAGYILGLQRQQQ
jgi:hypothetical protein